MMISVKKATVIVLHVFLNFVLTLREPYNLWQVASKCQKKYDNLKPYDKFPLVASDW